MEAQSSRIEYSEWDLNQLIQTCWLSRREINCLHSDYVQAAEYDSVMNMNEFIQLYSYLPGIEMQNTRSIKEQIVRLFRMFDRDRTGTLSFNKSKYTTS